MVGSFRLEVFAGCDMGATPKEEFLAAAIGGGSFQRVTGLPAEVFSIEPSWAIPPAFSQ